MKQFKPLLTDRGKIECKVSIDGKYSLPLYWDSSDEYWIIMTNHYLKNVNQLYKKKNK